MTNTKLRLATILALTEVPIRKEYFPPYLIFYSENGRFYIYVTDVIKHWDGVLEWSTNKTDWSEWNGGAIDSVDGFLYLRGRNNTIITGNTGRPFWKIVNLTGAPIECIGNIEMLLDYPTAMKGSHPNMGEYCYFSLFLECRDLISAPTLPAITLTTGCYQKMFGQCYNLKHPPKLPARNLAYNCYREMFWDCRRLEEAPELSATTLAPHCYRDMFSYCNLLSSPPELPATSLAVYCYSGMFSNCLSLRTVPSLPAMNLASGCYSSMFASCSNIKNVPDDCLPAYNLESFCYTGMFMASGLTKAPRLPADYVPWNAYTQMFYSCYDLVSPPELPATSIGQEGYREMFARCFSLTVAPALPGRAAKGAYQSMFESCTSLVEPPPIIYGASDSQCITMFRGCSSLKYTPALTNHPSQYYQDYNTRCYAGMFQNCRSLERLPKIKSGFTSGNLGEYFASMFSNCISIHVEEPEESEEGSSLYSYEYRIPTEGSFIDDPSPTNPTTNMFSGTGGPFTGTPQIEKIYYTQYEPVDVNNILDIIDYYRYHS